MNWFTVLLGGMLHYDTRGASIIPTWECCILKNTQATWPPSNILSYFLLEQLLRGDVYFIMAIWSQDGKKWLSCKVSRVRSRRRILTFHLFFTKAWSKSRKGSLDKMGKQTGGYQRARAGETWILRFRDIASIFTQRFLNQIRNMIEDMSGNFTRRSRLEACWSSE